MAKITNSYYENVKRAMGITGKTGPLPLIGLKNNYIAVN